MTTTATSGQKVDLIPLNLLQPSPTNPRKAFDEKALNELADSIKINGVTQPLLCRSLPSERIEIVWGERRFRAAKIAGVKTIPAMVRELSDEQVIQLQLVENLQREDLTPLEEAEGFQQLLKTDAKMTTKEIGRRIGKPERYVVLRLKLLSLIPKHKERMLKGTYSIGVGMQLARLQPDAQAEVPDHVLNSEQQLSRYIENNILLDLTKAKFDIRDEKLVPKAGSCIDCPKRTGANKVLFSDIKQGDTCTDPSCYRDKQNALVQIIVEKNTAKGTDPVVQVSDSYTHDELPKGLLDYTDYTRLDSKSECDYAEKAVVAHGTQVGKVIHICRSKDCKKHNGRVGLNSGESPRAKSQRLARDREQRTAKEVRHRVFRKVVEAVSTLERPEFEEIATSLVNKTQNDNCRRFVRIMGMDEPEKKGKNDYPRFDKHLLAKISTFDNRQLYRFIVGMCLLHDADEPPSGEYGIKVKPPDTLLILAKSYKVDVKQVEKDFLASKDKKKQKADMKEVVEASGRKRVKDAKKAKA